MGHEHGRLGHALARPKAVKHPLIAIAAKAHHLHMALHHQKPVAGSVAFMENHLARVE